jgi:hypothetical protein
MLSKKDKPAVRRSKLPGTPVPLPTPSRPKRVPGQPVPVPMPKGESNYGKGRGLQPRKPAGPKKSGITSKPNSRAPKPLLPMKPKRSPARRKMI